MRARAADQRGVTLIEVLISAIVVNLIAAGVALALVAGAQTTADQRHRSQASELAQLDQERLKGLSAAQLDQLDTPQSRSVTLDGTPYTITSSAQFLNSTGGSSCGSTGAGAAAYYEVVTSINWSANRRTPVVVKSLITPPAGGTLLTQVVDQTGAPLSGVGVAASGADVASGTTDANGCTIFAGLESGDYTLTLTAAGYVDSDDDPSPVSESATVTGIGTSTPSSGNPITLGQAGTFNAAFTANSGALTGQQADAISWYGAGSSNSMAAYKSQAYGSAGVQGTPIPSSGSIQLFPFAFKGPPVTYTGNYQVWAGPCRQQQPPAGVDMFTVGPGSNQTMAVQQPALNVVVNYNSVRVKPSHVKLTFTSSTGTSCTDAWQAAIVSDAATDANGSLASPGQPFASTATSGSTESASGYKGTLTACADYSTANRKATSSSFTNTNFTSATPVTINITSSSSSGTC